MPRFRYIPCVNDQYRVRELAALGASQQDIAIQLRLPLPKLQKIFELELQEGAAQGRERALKKLNSAALEGNISALIFWVKSQCGWRDTGVQPGAATAPKKIMLFKCAEPKLNAPAA